MQEECEGVVYLKSGTIVMLVIHPQDLFMDSQEEVTSFVYLKSRDPHTHVVACHVVGKEI